MAHMQEHAMKWHCDAEPHSPLKFDSAVDYESHMSREHKGTFTDRQLPYLTRSNAWADDPLYEQCPLCKAPEIKGSVIEHVINHLRYLALRSLPNMDERQSLSTIDDSLFSGPGQTRTTIREASVTTDQPLFTTPLLKRPDDDLADGEDPYGDWNGYDAFISLFPNGIPRLVAEKPVKTFSLPPEPSQQNLDEYGYPTSWPPDPSVNFVWPGTTRSDEKDYEWSRIWNKINPVSVKEEDFSKEELAHRIIREMSEHRVLGPEGRLEYMPDASLDRLITRSAVVETLKYAASEQVVEFILNKAKKLFAITLLSIQDPLLCFKALEIFRHHYMTDSVAPVPYLGKISSRASLTQCSRLGAYTFRCSDTCGELVSEICRHDERLTAFHHDVWDERSFMRFFDYQWHFYIPHLDPSIFIYEFEPEMILPFASYSSDLSVRSGYFSNVIRVKMLQRCQTSIDSVGRQNSVVIE
jgi:hypothetical protein